MSHKTVLKQLFPLDLGALWEDDLGLEGAHLDQVQRVAVSLLREFFVDSCAQALTNYERIYAITPPNGATLQQRRDSIVAKMLAKWGLTIQFFTNLAARMGYTIEIEELQPNTDGCGPEGISRWRVHIPHQPIYYFRVGSSRAGERLVDGPVATALEDIFRELKPAHTQVLFSYES